MRKKKSPAGSGAGPSRFQAKRFSLFLLIRLFIIFGCVFSAWLFWLDYRIQHEFEGKRWSLPARVYASAQEIYVGQALSLDDLEEELKATGYQLDAQLSGQGRYHRRNNSLEFVKRPFVFWDGEEMSRHLRVTFNDNNISNINDLSSGHTPGIIRLEPQLIGKIFPQHNEDRVVVPYDEVPPFLVTALIAVEDRNFFSHHGVDLRGILRALLTNLRQGHVLQGGSTLTQQLVKNFFLNRERTYWRKFNEMIMAILLERRYSKADILSAYINEIYLGQHGFRSINGFGTAAEYYFGRPLQELRNDQLALLVGLVRGASYYNPYKNPKRALKRRNLVLKLLADLKYENSTEMNAAWNQAMDLSAKPGWSRAKYPAFLDLVRRQLLRDYRLEDLRNEGLRIFTTLEPRLQEKLELALQTRLSALEQGKNLQAGSLEVAAIALHPGSGEIAALAGGRDRENISFNRAIEARRSIGSLIKPLIYYLALSEPARFNVLSSLDDSPVSIKLGNGEVWQPRNYDRLTHHNVTLDQALAQSHNQATVRLGIKLGLERIVQLLKTLGFSKNVEEYPSLLLGAVEMTPLEVAQIYQSFANGGFQIPTNGIREVQDSHGRALHRYPLQMHQVLEPAPAFLVNFLMTRVVSQGTARSLTGIMPAQLPLAGKTGTTNDLRDSWFAGFGDNLLAVVWVGRDDNEPSQLTGASGAMRVWADFMRTSNVTSLALAAPEEISWTDPLEQTCHGLTSVPYVNGFKPAEVTCR